MEEMEVQIVQKAIQGDEAAFEQLISRKRKNILYIACHFSNKQLSEECAQEAIWRIYSEIKTLNHPEYFDSWMYMVVRNTCVSIMRKQKETVSIDEVPEVGVIQKEEREFLPFE